MTDGSSPTPDQKPVRFGVIGAGWFACRRHLPDIKDNHRAVAAALCRRDPEAREKVAKRFDVPPERAFEDWQEMLDKVELDAVLIATPPYLHFEQAKAALNRGLHVLLEKPMTVRASEARELVALAHGKNLKLSVALNPPFWSHCHQMRRALKEGKMGTLESVTMYWTGSAEHLFGRAPQPENLPGVVPPTMYRADPELGGGGYFIDGGSHLISEVLWVPNLRAVRVSAMMDALPCDMRAIVNIELENGAFVSVNTVGDSRFSQRRVRNVFGASNGSITVKTFAFETTVIIPGHEPRTFREEQLLPVANPISNLVDAIQGRTALFSPPEHGAHVVEVVEAAYESARTGQTIVLNAEVG